MTGTIIGIDFGTSTSLVSVSTARGAQVLPVGRRNKWIPSIAGLSGSLWAVGDDAADFDEPSLIRSVKRMITEGKELVTVSDGQPRTLVKADDVIRDLLTEIRTRAIEAGVSFAEDDVTVRLGCPAMWTGAQRERLLRLATEARLPVHNSTLIDEPIAAGVAWVNSRVAQGADIGGKVLVYDMGGGTLDIAVLRVKTSTIDGIRRADIAVQAANGTDIAGDRVDHEIARTVRKRLSEAGFDALDHPELEGWILRKASEAKVELSHEMQADVVIPHPTIEVPAVQLFREDIDAAIAPHIDDSLNRVWEVARAALMVQVAGSTAADVLSPDQARALGRDELVERIDYVLLAGGMSQVPAVAERLGEVFGHNRIMRELSPEELIARGLGADESYESLNLHRPGFDFVLEWEDETHGLKSLPAYRAYTPLYDRVQAQTQTILKYTHRFPLHEMPKRGTGRFRARSVSGDTIRLTIDDETVEGIDFKFGHHQDAVFTIEPNGRVLLRDSAGYRHDLFIERWPVIRGRGHEAVRIRKATPAPAVKIWGYDESGD